MIHNMPEFERGTVVDDYRILAKLGQGGMGKIYLCEHIILNKEYAMKTLSSGQGSDVNWRRFQAEARAISKLSHGNIIKIHNMGVFQGQPYYVMDVLEGQTLKELISSGGPLPVVEGLKIILAVCAGLEYAHNNGIIHRDIKPSNIMLVKEKGAEQTVVKLVDFGLVKSVGDAVQCLTATGEILGSPYYMSPEQTEGGKLEFSSDLYSLGVTLVETLTGTLPFMGSNAVQTSLMHQTAPAPYLAHLAPDMVFSPQIEAVVAKLLRKDPAQRYQNCARLTQDLEKLLLQAQAADGALPRRTDEFRFTNKPQVFRSSESTDSDTYSTSSGTGQRKIAVPLTLACTALIAVALVVIFFTQTPEKAPPFTAPPVTDMTDRPAFRADVLHINPAIVNLPIKTYLIKDDDSGRTFQFPPGLIMGDFSQSSPTATIRQQPGADGTLFVPRGWSLSLIVDNALANNPKLLRGFGENDLSGISLQNFTHRSGVMIEEMTHMKGIFNLDLTGTDCTSTDFRLLKNLNQVKILKVNFTDLSPADISDFPSLPFLSILEWRRCKQPTQLLEILSSQKNINNLALDSTKLGSHDFKLIAGMSDIEYLSLADCGLKATDLKILASLHSLVFLELKNQIFETDCIEPLRRFPAKTIIELDDQDWTENEKSRLISNRPKIKLCNYFDRNALNNPSIKKLMNTWLP